MLQPKDTDWLNGYKNKTYIYAVYKKPTSDLKTHVDWKWEDGKIYSMQMGSKRKQSSYQTCVSLLIFCFDDLSIGVNGVLKSPTIIVLL